MAALLILFSMTDKSSLDFIKKLDNEDEDTKSLILYDSGSRAETILYSVGLLLVAVGSKFVWRLKKVIFDFFLFIVYFYKLELLTEKMLFFFSKLNEIFLLTTVDNWSLISYYQ